MIINTLRSSSRGRNFPLSNKGGMLPAYPGAAAVEGEVERGRDDLFPTPPILVIVTDLFGVEVWGSPNNLDYTAIEI